MKYIICILLLLLFPVHLNADTFSLAWDPVTRDANDNTLISPPSYKVYLGPTLGAPISSYTAKAVTTLTNYSLYENRPGTWYIVVTAYNSAGESSRSNEISITVRARPAPPVNLRLR